MRLVTQCLSHAFCPSPDSSHKHSLPVKPGFEGPVCGLSRSSTAHARAPFIYFNVLVTTFSIMIILILARQKRKWWVITHASIISESHHSTRTSQVCPVSDSPAFPSSQYISSVLSNQALKTFPIAADPTLFSLSSSACHASILSHSDTTRTSLSTGLSVPLHIARNRRKRKHVYETANFLFLVH